MKTSDEIRQRAEWQARLIAAIIARAHDDATLRAMLVAGLQQAYSEGLGDAAWICERAAEKSTGTVKRCAAILGQSIADFDRLNKAGEAAA